MSALKHLAHSEKGNMGFHIVEKEKRAHTPFNISSLWVEPVTLSLCLVEHVRKAKTRLWICVCFFSKLSGCAQPLYMLNTKQNVRSPLKL